MNRKCVVVLIAVALLAAAGAPGSALTYPSIPVLVNANPNGSEGDWYVGATPPGYDPAKPVIVFVQGLHGSAGDWWGPTEYYGNNDMYAYAYSSGYRTAFVDFRDAGGNAGSMWLNGSVFRTQLEKICAHFRVSRVNVVCHSKGGVDVQSAIVHYGAYPYVGRVFTLSTPHWGSEVADLSYSWWSWWLGALLGQHDDGTYVLQTSYMSYFRSITDGRVENAPIKYYTSAGNDWGPWFSALWFGGSYLSAYGSNDGLVTVTSAHNPRATHVNTGGLNHDNIRMGRQAWWYVEPQVRTLPSVGATPVLPVPEDPHQVYTLDSASPSGNHLLRGGAFKRNETLSVPVESSVRAVILDLMVADPGVTVAVLSPRGRKIVPYATFTDTGFFKGATHIVTCLERPEAGPWIVQIQSERENAYLLAVQYDAPLTVSLRSPKRWVKAGAPFDLNLDLNAGPLEKIRFAKASYILGHGSAKGQFKKVFEGDLDKKPTGFGRLLYAPADPGLYSLALDVEGTAEDGTAFRRSVVWPIVVEPGSGSRLEFLRNLVSQDR